MILHVWIAFYSAVLNIHRSGALTTLIWLVPRETAAVSARSVYTIQPCTMLLHAKPHTQGACVFSCNLPPALLAEWPGFFLRATAVTRGWNGYRNKSQHRKSTLEKKFSRRSSRDSNPRPFNHESGALTTELSPFPAYQRREEKAWLATYCALLHYILSNYLVIRITGTRIVHFICIFRCQCSYIAMVEEW